MKHLKQTQNILREELKEIILNKEFSITALSESIDVSHVTLARFLNGVDISLTPLMKIEKWLIGRHSSK